MAIMMMELKAVLPSLVTSLYVQLAIQLVLSATPAIAATISLEQLALLV